MAYSDADDMLRQFEARIDDQLQQADQLRTAMEAVQVTEESRAGDVVVTVDSTGGLADLRLSGDALRRSPAELAEEILRCSQKAQSQLAQRMSQAMGRVLGPGSQTAAFVSDTFAERFPAAPARPEDDPDRYRDPYSERTWGQRG